MSATDLIGMPIRYCGLIYVIEGVNYLGDFDIVRFLDHRKVWQRTSIPTEAPPATDPRHWHQLGEWHQKRLKHAILGAQRLHPWTECRSKSARHWRRARAYRGVLRRFFRRIQTRAVPPRPVTP